MKNPLKAMSDYVKNNGNDPGDLNDVFPAAQSVAKFFLKVTAPVVGVAALFQKPDKEDAR